MDGVWFGSAIGGEKSLNEEATLCWERGRPARTERKARTILRDMASRRIERAAHAGAEGTSALPAMGAVRARKLIV